MTKTVQLISCPRAMSALIRIEEFVVGHARGWDAKNLADDIDIVRAAIPDGGGGPAIKELERLTKKVEELEDQIENARRALS